METARKRLPSWAKKPLGAPSALHPLKAVLRSRNLNTVCESARCPNIGECFSKPTATFMILGNSCTRRCGFCSVDKLTPVSPVDPHEPANIALTAREMGLKHVVLTSVTRDDLADGGASQFALTIRALKDSIIGTHGRAPTVEVLVPDFGGNVEALKAVFDARPDVFNHNLETVPSLYPAVRPAASYERSLEVLRAAAEAGIFTKSGIMAGLGESGEEVRRVMDDVKETGAQALTIGQYLQPTKANLPVVEYVEPEVFAQYEAYGLSIGLKYVYSGTFVRSSYNAEMFTGVEDGGGSRATG